MSDKIRGAVFNALGDVSGLTVLDTFAGTGAIGFEALSRGAEYVTSVEVDGDAHRTIEENAQKLGVTEYYNAIRTKLSSWSYRNANTTFDIVVCDPPYTSLQFTTVEKMQKHVKPGGLLVLSWPTGADLPRLPKLEQVHHKIYANAEIRMYRRPESLDKPESVT